MRDPAPPEVVYVYTTLLERAIIHLRYRVRSGDNPSPEELHDFLDAPHNIPTMLRDYGGWMVEQNIDADLARYDSRWLGRPDSEMRQSLTELLEWSRRGACDRPSQAGGSGGT